MSRKLCLDVESKRRRHLEAAYRIIARPFCDAMLASLQEELRSSVYQHILEDPAFEDSLFVHVLDQDTMNEDQQGTERKNRPLCSVPPKTSTNNPWKGPPCFWDSANVGIEISTELLHHWHATRTLCFEWRTGLILAMLDKRSFHSPLLCSDCTCKVQFFAAIKGDGSLDLGHWDSPLEEPRGLTNLNPGARITVSLDLHPSLCTSGQLEVCKIGEGLGRISVSAVLRVQTP